MATLGKIVALSIVLAGLAACETARKVEEEFARLNGGLGKEHVGRPTGGSAGEGGRPILGTTVVRSSLGERLPGDLETRPFGFQADAPLGLSEVAAKIAEMTGLSVRVSDLRERLGSRGTGGAGGGSLLGGDMEVTPATAGAAFRSTLGGGVGGSGGSTARVYVPSYEGTLPGFLRALEPRFDARVSVRGGELVIETGQVVECTVSAPPTVSTLTTEVSGATSGAASGPSSASAGQSAANEARLDPFKEVKAELQKLVGPGDAVEVSPSLRRFIVIGSAETARRVSSYCDRLGAFLNARIAVEMTIVEVQVSEGDDYGLNLEPVFRGAGIVAGLEGVVPAIVGATGTGSIRILPASEGGSQHWASSQAFVRAASTDGRLASSRRQAAVVSNGRAQTMVLATRQDYVRNVTSTQGTANSVPSSGTQTDSLRYGYSAQITTHLSAGGEIQISGAVLINDLAAMKKESFGDGQFVNLLTVPERAFDFDIVLGNNETLVLSGNEHERVRRDRTGVIAPGFFGFGGGSAATTEMTRVVLFLTAYRVASINGRTGGGER